jgi:hypothetical protein
MLPGAAVLSINPRSAAPAADVGDTLQVALHHTVVLVPILC